MFYKFNDNNTNLKDKLRLNRSMTVSYKAKALRKAIKAKIIDKKSSQETC